MTASHSDDADLAVLASIFENRGVKDLKDALQAARGNVETAIDHLCRQNDVEAESQLKVYADTVSASKNPSNLPTAIGKRKRPFFQADGANAADVPTSHSGYNTDATLNSIRDTLKWTEPAGASTTKFLKALDLYTPEAVSKFLPCCVMISDVLPKDLALRLFHWFIDEEVESWSRHEFIMFERPVQSHHTSCFYVDDPKTFVEEGSRFYNGKEASASRAFNDLLIESKAIIADKVNEELAKRTRFDLEYAGAWKPNVAAANCYEGPADNLSWHCDRLTSIGPFPTIGSLTLGATRPFRLRRVVPPGDNPPSDWNRIYNVQVPHNCLLIMFPPCQEEYKHALPAVNVLDPFQKKYSQRINITMRMFRPDYGPSRTPICPCKVPCILRTVQKAGPNLGRFFWMCDAGRSEDKAGKYCTFFQWEDGRGTSSIRTPPNK